MIKNIVFDMGGVLIHFKPAALLAHFDISPADRDLMLKEAFGSVAWIQLDRGTISAGEALEAMQANLPERLHPVAEELVNLVRIQFIVSVIVYFSAVNGWWKLELRPMKGMEQLLGELKELGYGIYLLSNATVRQPEYFPLIPGSQYFDGQIISAQWKLLKPQHEIYETLLREYGLRAEECFFVDDLNINIEGALCAGMSGTVFDGDAARLRRDLRRAGVPVKTDADR